MSCWMTSGSSVGPIVKTAEEHATFDDAVENILVGEYENPQTIFAFNPAEGWSKDITLDVALRSGEG